MAKDCIQKKCLLYSGNHFVSTTHTHTHTKRSAIFIFSLKFKFLWLSLRALFVLANSHTFFHTGANVIKCVCLVSFQITHLPSDSFLWHHAVRGWQRNKRLLASEPPTIVKGTGNRGWNTTQLNRALLADLQVRIPPKICKCSVTFKLQLGYLHLTYEIQDVTFLSCFVLDMKCNP